MIRVGLFIAIILLVSSCDDSRLFESNRDLDSKIWMADSVIDFSFEIVDISKEYNLYINLRNTASYPYENIYMTYYLKDTADNLLSTALVDFDLFDSKTGQPYGDGLGDVFDHQFELLKNYKFDRPGPYIFELKQYMRMDSLPEILSAGVRVESAEVKK